MTGLFVANGYNNVFISKPRSMARFGLLILNHGSWNGNQIMTDTSYFNQMVNTSQTLNPSYGYLWWLNGKSSFMLPGTQFVFPGPLNPDAPADMFAAMGKNGQFLNIVPSMNLVYVRMGNAPGIDEVPFTINDTIWRKLNKVFCGMVSIQGVKDNNQLLIYPNPVDQYFNIELPGYFFDVQLSDITGKEVYRTKNTKDKLKIDCADREKGIYILNLETGYETVTRKIIKL